MTSLVDAISKKYERLKDYHTFGGCITKGCNITATNIMFPMHTLTMDCQNISSVGSESELQKAASHVKELDLSGNKLSSWEEVFRLLQCLTFLESLNLSQNPLGSQISSANQNNPYCQQLDRIHSTNHMLVYAYERLSDTNCENDPNNSLRSFTYVETNIMSRIDDFDKETVENYVDNSEFIEHLIKIQHSTTKESNQIESCASCPDSNVANCENVQTPIQTAIERGTISPNTKFTRLTLLVLNSTFIPWIWLIDLLKRLPNLTNLHIALNNYGTDKHLSNNLIDDLFKQDNTAQDAIPTFPQVRNLYCSDNGISDWLIVCYLALQFPGLEHLVLLGNPIDNIPKISNQLIMNRSNIDEAEQMTDSTNLNKTADIANTDTTGESNSLVNQTYAHLFDNLHTLNLSETLINQWDSIDALCEWMPNLINLRLGNNIPLFESLPEPSCRAEVVARLPNLSTYNRSAINSEERDKAERDFVRHYGQLDSVERPKRYWELERQHGYLEPLADIDLTPKRFIRVRISMEGKEIWHDLNVSLKVAQAKRHFCSLFGIKSPAEVKRFKLFYYDQIISKIQGPEELKFPSRALHSYQLEPGDLFELMEQPNFSKH